MKIEDLITFDTFITSVSFGDDSIEITFLEKREQSETVMMARTMIVPVDDDDSLQVYADVQDALRQLIEWGYVELRNPPEEFTEPRSTNDWVRSQMIGDE